MSVIYYDPILREVNDSNVLSPKLPAIYALPPAIYPVEEHPTSTF